MQSFFASPPNSLALIEPKDDSKAEQTPKAIRTNPGLSELPLSMKRIILGMLQLADRKNIVLANKACCEGVSFFWKQQARFLNQKIQLQRQIKQAEEKKKEELREKDEERIKKNRKVIEEAGPGQFYQEKTFMLLIALLKENMDSKQSIEKECQKTIDEITSLQRYFDSEIIVIQDQIAALDQFLTNVKRQKENKFFFSQRVVYEPERSMLGVVGMSWSLIPAFWLSKAISLGLGWIIAGKVQMVIVSMLPFLLLLLSIWVVLSLIIYCAITISFDLRGVERFNYVSLSSFSKKLQSDLEAIENLFLSFDLFIVCAMPDNILEEKKPEKLKIYVKAEGDVLTCKFLDDEEKIDKDEFEKILGKEKANEMFQVLESKSTSADLNKYKKAILQIASRKKLVLPSLFNRIDTNTVTLGRACEIAHEQHDFLLTQLSVFQKKKEEHQKIEKENQKSIKKAVSND